MKIDYALMSCDSNPLYLDFWPIVSKLWKLKIGLTPILIYVGNDDIPISTEYGEVVRVPLVDGISPATQSQLARYWYVVNKPEDVCIISDIDMLPLSKHYFIDLVKDFSDDSWIHLNDCFDGKHMSTCYHVAKGSLFNDVWKVESDWTIFVSNVVSEFGYDENGKPQWFCDELWATDRIHKHSNKSVFKFLKRDLGQNGHRIDRPGFNYNSRLLRCGFYYDAHCPRPYAQYKYQIENIANKVLASGGCVDKKVLVLVLATENPECVVMNDSIRNTWQANCPDDVIVKHYYGRREEDQTEILEMDDRIYCLTEETYKNMIYKTIEAFEYLLDNYNFSYIFRTCNGSYLNLERLLQWASNKNETGVYCGVVGNFRDIEFVSGAGYLISRDVVEKVVSYSKSNVVGDDLVDDVELARILKEFGISPQRLDSSRIDMDFGIGQVSSVPLDGYHYHFRHAPDVMYKLHERIFG